MHASTLLRRARLTRGLTVAALAAAAGTPQPTLTAYETGRVTPGVGTFRRVVEAAGYAVDVRLARRHRDGPTPEMTRGDEPVQVDCGDLAVLKAFSGRTKDSADLEEMHAAGSLDVTSLVGTLTLLLGVDDRRVARVLSLVSR